MNPLRLMGVTLVVVFGASPVLAGASHANFERVCLVTIGGDIDATREAATPFPDDVPVGARSQGPTYFAVFASPTPFHAVEAVVGIAGSADGTMVWLYSRAGGMSELNVSGDTAFKNAGRTQVAFEPPADWLPARMPNGCGGPLYQVRAITREPFSLPPVLSQAWPS